MTQRHRIARVITRLNIGGPSIQAITLSRELTTDGFDTCLIHGHLADGEGDMRSILSADGITQLHLKDLRRPVSPGHDVRACWRLYRAFCRWRPSVVHTHMAKAGALGRLAAVAYNWTAGRSAPARLVHTYHGHVFDGYFGSPSTRVFLAVERWLARRTDVLIAISPQIRHDLLDTYRIARPDQVQIIPLGFNLDRLAAIDEAARARARAALDIPANALIVTTVGRLTAIKQHSLFLDAALRIAARQPEARFLIVGDGELRGELEHRVQALGLTAAVRFLGWRGDLETVYGATDVFVLTSRNEGTPVALIEAMASGVASVSTDVGGVRDVITDPTMGTLVPFGDPQAISDAVLRLAESAALRADTGVQARAAVLGRFNLSRLVADMRSLYLRLLTA